VNHSSTRARVESSTRRRATSRGSSRNPVKISAPCFLVLNAHIPARNKAWRGLSALCSRSALRLLRFFRSFGLSLSFRSFGALVTAPSRQVRSVRSFVDRFESKHRPARRQGPSSFIQAPIFVAQGPRDPFRSSRSSTSFGIASALASSSYVLVSSSAGSKRPSFARVRSTASPRSVTVRLIGHLSSAVRPSPTASTRPFAPLPYSDGRSSSQQKSASADSIHPVGCAVTRASSKSRLRPDSLKSRLTESRLRLSPDFKSGVS
jgi:hypothetical protein